jgi:predicted enzyme related to lactoylglutathione lyase
MNLNQVTVPCIALSISISFYHVLGLCQIVHSPPDYARFECPVGGATFSLHRVARVPQDHGVIVYFELEDLDASIEQLAAAGVEFESGPRDEAWLWREARLRDPAGNQICLFAAGENRRNPPWRLPVGAS